MIGEVIELKISDEYHLEHKLENIIKKINEAETGEPESLYLATLTQENNNSIQDIGYINLELKSNEYQLNIDILHKLDSHSLVEVLNYDKRLDDINYTNIVNTIFEKLAHEYYVPEL